jgi:hypothetical protein
MNSNFDVALTLSFCFSLSVESRVWFERGGLQLLPEHQARPPLHEHVGIASRTQRATYDVENRGVASVAHSRRRRAAPMTPKVVQTHAKCISIYLTDGRKSNLKQRISYSPLCLLRGVKGLDCSSAYLPLA